MWMMGKNVPSATADHKKLGMADMPDGHAAIQRELSWPAKWANSGLTKFPSQVLCLNT